MGRSTQEIIMKKYIIIISVVALGYFAIKPLFAPKESACEGFLLPTEKELQKFSEGH